MKEQIKGIKVNGTPYAVNGSAIETHLVSANGTDFILTVDASGGVYGYKEGVNTSFPYAKNDGGSSAPSEGGLSSVMDDINMSENARQFEVGIADGDWQITEKLGESHAIPTSDYGVKTSAVKFALTINEVYANDREEYVNNPEHTISIPVSHNFVEIANLDPYTTFSLDNVSIQYYNPKEKDEPHKGWHILKLKGHINPGSTYLIRGAKVANSKAPSTIINVDTFDIEWYENGKLMAFNNTEGSFYLSHDDVIFPESDWVKNYASVNNDGMNLLEAGKTSPTYVMNTYISTEGESTKKLLLSKNYLDVVGWGAGNIVCETTPVSGMTENTILVRRNMLDRAKQAIPTALANRTNAIGKYLELVEVNKNYIGNEAAFKPCSVAENKNVYTTRSDMRENRPYCVTVSFGIDATKTRCFNWISPGVADEFVFYRALGESEWNIKQSYVEGDGQDSDIREKVMNFDNVVEGKTNTYNMHLPFYDRIYWETSGGRFVTSHKVILRNLENALTYYTDNTLMTPSAEPTEFTKGKVYEYCVGRAKYDRYKNPIGPEEEYCSPVYQFQVRPNTNKTWRFIHHSDEQGFNDCEYQVWRRTANIIRAQFNPQFTIDTGDMTQNGNRLSEWLDYNTGIESLSQGEKLSFKFGGREITNESAGVEQMNVVGNNDLAPIFDYVLGDGGDATSITDKEGKVTTRQFKYFYCYEIDPENMPATIGAKDVPSSVDGHTDEYEKEIKSWIPSCYSFNYNNCHFTAICSEITPSSAVNEYGEDTTIDGNGNTVLATYEKTYDLIEDWVQKDLNKWYQLSLDPQETATYPWAICYMHEMPWTILTSDACSAKEGARVGGCKLNDFGTMKFHMSEIFQNNRVRLVLGGHKHTHSHSWPMGENVTYKIDGQPKFSWELTNEQLNDEDIRSTREVNSKKNIVHLPFDLSDSIVDGYKTFLTEENPSASGNVKYPVRFQYNSEMYKVNENKESWLPVYIMSQASANKVKSNKEMPADSIPFLHYYYPCTETGKAKVHADQCYPHFVEYEFVQDGDSAAQLNIRHYRVAMGNFCDGKPYATVYKADESKDALATGSPLLFNGNTEDKLGNSQDAPIAQSLKWLSREETRTISTYNVKVGNSQPAEPEG